jgi:4a-hydroxytetrahydrobiopterin dehydratase
MQSVMSRTGTKVKRLAAQAKTAMGKAGDAVRDAAESTGETIRDAAKSTVRKIEDAGHDVGKKIGVTPSAPKVAGAKMSLPKVRAALSSVPGWKLDRGKLYREFRFAGFGDAFAFMTKLAKTAEALNHHPDWSNVYDTVRVHLATHDVGGISPLDFQLASAMNAAFKPLQPPRKAKTTGPAKKRRA